MRRASLTVSSALVRDKYPQAMRCLAKGREKLLAHLFHFTAEKLWANDALRSAIAVQAQNVSVQQNLLDSGSNEIIESINEFPIGWEKLPNSDIEWVKSILGWVLTAAAVSLGAPFWFHVLGRVANIRGSGGQTATGNGK